MMIPDWFVPVLGVVCFVLGLTGLFLLANYRGVRDAEEEESE